MISVQNVIEAVAQEWRLTPADLLARGRDYPRAVARDMAYRLAAELCGLSYPRLAKAFCRDDHTTVLKGAKNLDGHLWRHGNLRYVLHRIRERLGVSLPDPPSFRPTAVTANFRMLPPQANGAPEPGNWA